MIKVILKESWLSVMGNKMRTFLTMLGIMIGVCAVVVMVSAGQAIRIYIDKTFESMGGSLLILVPGTSTRSGIRMGRGKSTVTLSDVKALRQIEDVVAVAGIIGTGGQVVYGPRNWYSKVWGTSKDYLVVGNWQIERGTMFSDHDIQTGANVVVIGKTIADELFGLEDPVGKYIRLRNIPFLVIGLLKEKGESMMGNDEDNVIMAPITTVRQKLKGSRRPKTVDVAFVKVSSEDKISRVQYRVVSKLRARHKLKQTEDNDFSVRDLTEFVQKVRGIGRALSILLSLIASVSLLVGSIGIMNMMLVSVTERTREIGTRKALGASNKWILLQFLAEAVLISFIGSFFGLFFGVVFSQIGGILLDAEVPVSMWSVVLSATVAVGVGIISGIFPAYKAMKLHPIEALRYQ